MSCDDDYGVAREEFRGLTRGDTYDLPFLSEETEDEVITDATVWTARDLSGGTFECQVRVGSPDGEQWAGTATVLSSNAAIGLYTLRLSNTGAVVPGYEYVFDIEYTEGSTIETLVAGVLEFEADVTHD